MASIIITLLIALYKIPLINLMGDKGMGYYSIALSIYLLLMTCMAYGLPKAVSSLIIKQSSKGQYALAYKTTIYSLIFSAVAGGLLAIIVFVCADIIAIYIMGAVYSAYAIRAFSPALLMISVLGALHGIYTGNKLISISHVAHKIEEVAVAVLSIVGLYIFTGIEHDVSLDGVYSSMGAAVGYSAGIFIACVFLLILFINFRKKLKRLADKTKMNEKTSFSGIVSLLIKTMLPFVLTLFIFHLSNVIDYAVFNKIMSVQGHKENSYIILLGMLNGKYEFFISIPLILVNWYAATKVPFLTKIVHEDNKRKIHNKISQYMRYTMLFMIPCSAVYILYAKPLMDLIFTANNDTPAMMLRIGAVSVIFYSLTTISNAVLNVLEDWKSVSKNAFIALVVQVICLFIMMIIFQWGIIAVVISRIVFSAALFILNEHTLREKINYVQEYKRTFTLPIMATIIVSIITFILYFILGLLIPDKVLIILILLIMIPVYLMALIFTGGITQREMYQLPGGKYLAPLCKKLHLIN